MYIQRTTLLVLVAPVVLLVIVAYIQWVAVGLPAVPAYPPLPPEMATPPYGFPTGVRLTHYVNFLFLILLIRSGLQILMDHPRLYWSVHCTPGTEWLRLTPIQVPHDRVWTAKDDSRYLSPWIGLPGYRHTVGMARHWHFLSVLFWVANGIAYVTLLCTTSHWQRLVPGSWRIVPEAWAVWVHYATWHLPPEPNGFYHYNPLQQLAYCAVVFVLAPLAILTGPAMSPALTARFSWYPKLPGNRQIGRSLHFLVLCAFVAFLVVHVTLVVYTGFARNMNHIVLGTDDRTPLGLYLGLLGIGVVVLVNVLANWAAWRHPRAVQHAAKAIVTPVMAFLLDRAAPRAEFRRADISPFLWANGKVPTCEAWKALAADGFKDYRLKVYGLVEPPGRVVAERPAGTRPADADHPVSLHSGLVRDCCLDGAAAGRGDPVGATPGKRTGRGLLFFRRGGRRRSVLRQPRVGRRPAPANPAGVRHELRAAGHVARGAVATAGREPARLQDGEMDRGD
jgi:thiosulfate reductase cytochrome b subunit